MKIKEIKPIEGIVEKAWLNMRDLTENCLSICDLHIKLQGSNKKYEFDFFPIRVNKGERVRLWPEYSHPKFGAGGYAIQFLDSAGEVQFTVGRSGYYACGGNCNYDFNPKDIEEEIKK